MLCYVNQTRLNPSGQIRAADPSLLIAPLGKRVRNSEVQPGEAALAPCIRPRLTVTKT